jgi:hypothetical protein
MERTLFYHGTTTDGRKFTIAGKYVDLCNINFIDPKSKSDDIDCINFGLSLCSKNDQFNKKIGRNKAEGRMNSVSSPKGKSHFELYGFEENENYFKGQEIDIFIKACSNFDTMNSKQLRRIFNLR